MIRKIILENYMAHVRTVIEPAAGLTVLVGPNNCGKSAIIHALEMICYNSDAAGFAIRHGAKKATVTVETEDEDGTVHTLVWWRTKGTAGYIIDGREISGMGKGKIPDDLHQFLRMPAIKSGSGDPFLIHFGLQKDPIFLLNDPASRAAQFFASSSDADRLMEMQRRHKQKEANAKRDKEKLDQEILKLDQQLEGLSPLAEISPRLIKLELDHAEIVANESRLLAMSRAIEALNRAEQAEQICLMRANSLLALKEPPSFQTIEPLAKQINAMAAAERRAAINQANHEVLIDLKPAPLLAETSGLSRLIGELAGAGKRLDLESEKLRAIDPLRETSAQDDSVGLSKQIALIESTSQKVQRIEARVRRLEQLEQPIAQLETKSVAALIGQIEKSETHVVSMKRIFQIAEKSVLELRAQIEQWVLDNPRCLSCGQEISAELILAGEEAAHVHR